MCVWHLIQLGVLHSNGSGQGIAVPLFQRLLLTERSSTTTYAGVELRTGTYDGCKEQKRKAEPGPCPIIYPCKCNACVPSANSRRGVGGEAGPGPPELWPRVCFALHCHGPRRAAAGSRGRDEAGQTGERGDHGHAQAQRWLVLSLPVGRPHPPSHL